MRTRLHGTYRLHSHVYVYRVFVTIGTKNLYSVLMKSSRLKPVFFQKEEFSSIYYYLDNNLSYIISYYKSYIIINIRKFCLLKECVSICQINVEFFRIFLLY